MRRVSLSMRGGPMAGSSREATLGRLTLGRSPGPEGYLLDGDARVSRRHGELLEAGGRVVYRNLSPNGSRVDGDPVEGDRVLDPGAVLELGGHRIEVRFEASPAEAREAEGSGSLWSSGPMARPAVRAALALYLLALAALVLAAKLDDRGDLRSLWRDTREAYLVEYRPGRIDPEVRATRLRRAEEMVLRLLALERSERWEEARTVCRELMAIDGDPASPIYRFAARRLGTLARER